MHHWLTCNQLSLKPTNFLQYKVQQSSKKQEGVQTPPPQMKNSNPRILLSVQTL